MAKRKVKRAAEERQNKRRQQADEMLDPAVFAEEQAADYADYERAPRQFKPDLEEGQKLGLPIRGEDGTMQKNIIVEEKAMPDVSESEDEDASEDAAQKSSDGDEEEKAHDEGEEVFNEEDEESYKGLTEEEKLVKTKEDIADMCERLMQDPEENVLLLSRLIRMCGSKNPLTCQMAALSLAAVFKNIAPSYHIRPLTEVEKKEKVSREVAKLRFYEQNLVLNYKKYVDFLARKALKFAAQPKVTPFDAQMGIITTQAACELAIGLRFFNYRFDLIQILTRRIMRKPQNEQEFKVFEKSVKTIEDLLVDDQEHGSISFDVVRLLSKSVRRRDFNVDESVINTFLCLTILNDYDPNSSEREDKPKLKKKDRVHISKKERKRLKEEKAIDAELRQAEQAITAEERERFQAQILKMLLMFYLEALKARPEKLMASVLESLSKFGHMVNIELMGDFLQVLREISEDIIIENDYSSDKVKQVLLCIITSFSLVANLPQRKVIVDLNKFVDYLYTLLPHLALDTDIEYSHKTLRLMDPLLSTELNLKPNVNVSTKAELLLRCLNVIFFNSKSGSAKRSLAFVKRLSNASLNLPEKTSITIMKFLDKLFGRYEEIKNLYTTEDRIQNGVYYPESNEIERANTEVAVLWENVLLENHYCPNVSMGVKHIMKKV